MPCNDVPSEIVQEVEAAASIADLVAINARMLDRLRPAISIGSDTRNIVQFISGFNDAITARLIALVEKSDGIALPEGAAYLVLGSEGRGEQTLRTDQDSAIVHIDGLSPEKIADLKRFAEKVVAALEETGVPRCPGNIMANSNDWCHSSSEWKMLVDEWIAAPTPENMLRFGMLQDLRSLHGDDSLGIMLRGHICSAIHSNPAFFPNMAAHVVRFPSPFTMFRRIRVEQSGEHKGMVELKKSGIFAISAGVSLLALEQGRIGGTTWEKLDFLEKSRFFTKEDHKTIADAFTCLTGLRLKLQLRQMAINARPTNYLNPQLMDSGEHHLFRKALKGAETFLWIFRRHYSLDSISI